MALCKIRYFVPVLLFRNRYYHSQIASSLLQVNHDTKPTFDSVTTNVIPAISIIINFFCTQSFDLPGLEQNPLS